MELNEVCLRIRQLILHCIQQVRLTESEETDLVGVYE